MVNSSDLVLAAGISFWSGVVETQSIKDIQDCYQVITALRGFLQQNKTEEIKPNGVEGFNAENNKGNFAKEDEKSKVSGPAKPLGSETNANDSDLDDLFEVIDPSEEREKEIEEERSDFKATEESMIESIVEAEVEPPEADVQLAGQNEEDKIKPEKLAGEMREDMLKMKVKVEIQNILSRAEGKVKRKKKKTTESLPKQCDHCKMIYPKFIDLKQHMSLVHSEKMEDFEKKHKTCVCLLCPYKAYSRNQLAAHLKSSHVKNVNCRLCDSAFYTEEDLRRHQTRHENEENKFPCRKCGKYFMKLARLKLHLATVDCDVKLLQCPNCPKMVAREKLKRHLVTHDDTLYCKTCCRRFTKDKMILHKAKCELGQTKVKCRDCDLLFHSNNERARHQFLVHDINAQLCTLCGKKCQGLRDLQIHMKSHGSEELPCKHCDKKFKSERHLERHDRSMHQSDSEKRFQCSYPDCSRAFLTRQSLESHMNCHLGLKPYQCDVCETRFQNNSNKVAHMKNVHKFSKSSKNIQAI